MLNPNHPEDERLSALAARDTDATADASLAAHVSTCDRCTDLVNELGALRASLADLPDVAPSRPLRLLPEVADEPPRIDRLGGWARRFFAPVMAAGAALAMVGLVGTAAPELDQMASTPQAAERADVAAPGESGALDSTADGGSAAAPGAAEAQPTGAAGEGSVEADAQPEAFAESSEAASPSTDVDERAMAAEDEDGGRDRAAREAPAERSPWPMVLFTGVALMIAAALLRWILVPRAG